MSIPCSSSVPATIGASSVVFPSWMIALSVTRASAPESPGTIGQNRGWRSAQNEGRNLRRCPVQAASTPLHSALVGLGHRKPPLFLNQGAVGSGYADVADRAPRAREAPRRRRRSPGGRCRARFPGGLPPRRGLAISLLAGAPAPRRAGPATRCLVEAPRGPRMPGPLGPARRREKPGRTPRCRRQGCSPPAPAPHRGPPPRRGRFAHVIVGDLVDVAGLLRDGTTRIHQPVSPVDHGPAAGDRDAHLHDPVDRCVLARRLDVDEQRWAFRPTAPPARALRANRA